MEQGLKMRTLHILNGQEMYNYFQKTNYLEQDIMIPFNEAMCYGDTSADLFSPEFITIRAGVHHVTLEQYDEITLKPLQPLFREDFARITLWFDSDMFCQINLLTILAWLDHTHYEGEIIFVLVGEKFEPLRTYTVNKVEGYNELYKKVLIQKEVPETIPLEPLEKGIKLYLDYLKQDSDLLKYIQRYPEVPDEEMVSVLIGRYKEYGLGDTQYLEIVKTHRSKL